ncbi:MAG: hypothetical protein MK085_04535 [Phycisphaerales bacterium]|nr:hypothetical protein [Phycisphaerales bacterium]
MRFGTPSLQRVFAVMLLASAASLFGATVSQPQDGARSSPRTIILGGKVLMGFVNRGDRPAIPVWRDDIVLELVAGRIVKLTPESDYRARPGDVRIQGRGRYIAPAPIVFAKPNQDARWLNGTSLMRAIVHGVGHVVVSREMLESPVGRCAEYRVGFGEMPGALPVTKRPVEPVQVEEKTQDENPGRKVPEQKDIPIFEVDLPDRLLTSDEFASSLVAGIEELRKSGEDDAAIFRAMTSEAGVRIGRDDLGGIRYLATAAMVACARDPLEDLSAIFDPDMVILGNRVIRRAEIEVLRDAVDRSVDHVQKTLDLVASGKDGNPVHRWLSSVEGQVFGGVAIQEGDDGRYAFSAIQGQPRFDATSGWLRRAAPGEVVAKLTYDGPPESFECTMTRGADGLEVALEVSGRPSKNVDAPGPTTPPIFELPVDLQIRAKAMLSGTRDFEVQEFIFGNGPIAMAPRRLRCTRIDVKACPPCFEEFEAVYRIDVFDLEPGDADQPPVARMMVAFRNGEPVRILLDSEDGPSWQDRWSSSGVTID